MKNLSFLSLVCCLVIAGCSPSSPSGGVKQSECQKLYDEQIAKCNTDITKYAKEYNDCKQKCEDALSAIKSPTKEDINTYKRCIEQCTQDYVINLQKAAQETQDCRDKAWMEFIHCNSVQFTPYKPSTGSMGNPGK